MRNSNYWVIWPILILGLATILTNCQDDSNNIVNQNSPPALDTVAASIGSPDSGQIFLHNQVITFIGSAVLGNSTQIEEKDLVWTSDKDDVIGIGNSFKRSGLSVGNHTITLTATASSGEVGTATVQLINQLAANGLVVLIESPAGARIKPHDLLGLSASAIAPDGSPVTDPQAYEWRSNLEIDPGPFLGDNPNITPAGLTPGLHTVTLSVTVPDSTGGTITGAASIETTVEFEHSGITFDILQPANGSQLVQGNDLICSGSGSISGGGQFEEIVWFSSIDGEIGRSGTCVVTYLSLGTHRITVIGTASDGRKGTASIIIEVIQQGQIKLKSLPLSISLR